MADFSHNPYAPAPSMDDFHEERRNSLARNRAGLRSPAAMARRAARRAEIDALKASGQYEAAAPAAGAAAAAAPAPAKAGARSTATPMRKEWSKTAAPAAAAPAAPKPKPKPKAAAAAAPVAAPKPKAAVAAPSSEEVDEAKAKLAKLEKKLVKAKG